MLALVLSQVLRDYPDIAGSRDYPGCSIEQSGPDGTDLQRERRGKEREREGRLPVGTGFSREAKRGCCVPLDLRRHSGCLERRGEALCVLPCTWIWVHKTYALLCRWANSLDFRNVRSGVTSRNSQKVEGGEKRTHPLVLRDLGDFEFPLPLLFLRPLLLLSSPFDKWWFWEC